MTDEPRPASAVREYLGVLSRRKLHILATIAVVLACTVLGTAMTEPKYTSSTKVALEPTSNRNDLERFLFGATELTTQQEVLTSRPLVAGVLQREGLPSSPGRVKQFVDDELEVVTVPQTTVLILTVSSQDPARSARLVKDLADAYLAYLRADADERLRTALASLEAEQRTTQQRIALLEREAAGASGAVRASLVEERDLQYAELRFVVSRVVELRTASTLARRGQVIEDATVPEEPSSPNLRLNLALGLLLGAMLGVAVAFLRDWTDDRIHGLAVDGVVAVPLLGRVPLVAGGTPPPAEAASSYRRVQTRLLAASAAPHLRLAVLPAGDSDATAVAVGLASALRLSGREVVLVDTTGSVASDVDGRDGLQVVHTSVLPDPQQPAGAALETVLASSANRADVLVVGAPPHLTADGLEIGRRVGSCLLVVEDGRTTRAGLRASADELHAVGVHVVGIIVVQKWRARWSSRGGYADQPTRAASVERRAPVRT